jgi:hypothetical protein
VILELERDASAAPARWSAAVLRGSATASASCEQLRAGGVAPERVEVLLTALRDLADRQPETARWMS